MDVNKSRCPWITLGKHKICNRGCYAEYCGNHMYQIRQGINPPKPCKECGRGVRCSYQLCLQCGGNKLRVRLYSKEKKARAQFKNVLNELETRWVE